MFGIFTLMQLTNPRKYTTQGTLTLPLSNITEPFEAAYDLDNKLGFVGYYNNMSYTLY